MCLQMRTTVGRYVNGSSVAIHIRQDSERFEEDSLGSWYTDPESLCQNWRGWTAAAAARGATGSIPTALSYTGFGGAQPVTDDAAGYEVTAEQASDSEQHDRSSTVGGGSRHSK